MYASEMAARKEERAIAQSRSTNYDIVFRPIQYLGSKLRSIEHIVPRLTRCVSSNSTVLDAFTGTSVVAQALADSGLRVVATDAMQFCAIFAESLLCVGRNHAKSGYPDILFRMLVEQAHELEISSAYSDLIAKENCAIESSNPETLFSLASSISQKWGSTGDAPIVWRQGKSVQLSEICTKGIIAKHYAGTYFGAGQAVAIDKLRISIEIARESGKLSSWEYATSLTALMHSCSNAVFSPGKHFAQHHKTDSGKNLSFHKKRILSDRAVDIEQQFLAALHSAWGRPHDLSRSHIAKRVSMEDMVANSSWLPKIDLIYADPPYTAQQYSRFYHIPETLINYRAPTMQEFRGGPTIGKYPVGRFKSRFSSKRQAPGAFVDLVNLSTRLGASLAISYSDSASGKTGNDRMVQLDELVSICKRDFRNVHVEKLSHAYRQFNDASSAVKERSDYEYLLICDA